MCESAPTNSKVERSACVEPRAAELEFNLDSVQIEPIAKSHERSAFLCTNETIQNYCIKHARQNSDAYKIRAFVACMPGSRAVLGYYYLALTSYRINEKSLDDKSESKFGAVEAVPAVYLGMIGVHTNYQRRGIGKLLMLDAMQRTAKISQHAGLYALTLDAIDGDMVSYYRDNFDFQTFKHGETGLEMFLPIKTILAAIPEEK